MTAFQTIATEFYKAFEQRTRTDGAKFYSIRDGSPEWMRTLVHDVHDALDVGPNDWCYEHTRMIASNLTDVEDPDEDTVHEIADGLVDVYTSALTAWASMRLEYAALADEAQTEGLVAENATYVQLLTSAQYIALQRMTDTIVAALKEQADERDEAAAEVADIDPGEFETST